MIKNNKKRLMEILLGILFVFCITIGFTNINNLSNVKAASATTPKYSMMFDHKTTTSEGTGGGSRSWTSNGSGYSVSVQTAENKRSNVSVSIYGQSYSGTGSFAKGGYINSSTVNIVINTNLRSGSIKVTNSSGTEIGSGGKSLTLNNLLNGTYNVAFYFGGGTWVINSRAAKSVSVEGTSSFKVDGIKPTMSGASTSTTGKYVGKEFTVTASDSGSGVKGIYTKRPNISGYEFSSGSTKNITNASNGIYTFYAVDNAGNKSGYYYVNCDSILPTGSIRIGGGSINSQYAKGDFYYTASDSGSGIDYLEYMKPDSNSWLRYTSGYTINKESINGKYRFKAYDKAGNVSEVKSVILDSKSPIGYLYKGNEIVETGKTVSGSHIKFMASDACSGVAKLYVCEPGTGLYKPYLSGSQYSVDGLYGFYCVDNAGNSSNIYYITLDNTAPVITCAETDFYASYGREFTIKTDNIDDKLYIKRPGEYEYKLVGANTFTVKENDTDGRYYFYASDKIENSTPIYWIELKVAPPEISVMETGNGSKYVTWSDNSCTARLNGMPYSKNDIIKEEGNYEIVVTNSYGRNTTINFSLGHNYVLSNTVEKTCTTDGYSEYKCTLCGHTYKDNIVKATGHVYEDKIIEATCTEGGCVRHTCKICGNVYEDKKTEALGHKYVEEMIQATCTEDGGLKHTCARCGKSYLTDKVPAFGHDYETEVVTSPTCDEDGERHFYCKHCGEEHTKKIPCQGHNYEIIETKTENGVTIRRYVCTKCGAEYTQNMGEQYEKISNYVEVLFQKYSPYMVWVFVGTSGVWSIAMGVAYIIARKNEEKEKAKKMIINYVIGMVVIFGILVACPLLVRGIAYLVT